MPVSFRLEISLQCPFREREFGDHERGDRHQRLDITGVSRRLDTVADPNIEAAPRETRSSALCTTQSRINTAANRLVTSS
jgi:hypothetical protein